MATEQYPLEELSAIDQLGLKPGHGLELSSDDIVDAMALLATVTKDDSYKDFDAFKTARTFLSEIVGRSDLDETIRDLAESFATEIELAAGSDFTKLWLFERRRELRSLNVTRALEFTEAKTGIDYWSTQECIYFETQMALIDRRLLKREY